MNKDETKLSDLLKGAKGEPPTKKGAPLTAEQRVDVAFQVATSLSILHGQREATVSSSLLSPSSEAVFHRDIKSANISIEIHGDKNAMQAKLLDHSALKKIDDDVIIIDDSDSDVAIGNVEFPGGQRTCTFGYMAPEIARGKYSVQSEIYSLGVVFLELLFGKLVDQDTAFNEAVNVYKGSVDNTAASRAEDVWPE